MEGENSFDESTPLISELRSDNQTITNSFAQRHVIPLLYVIVFCAMFGVLLQPAPRTQIYESIICGDYYSNIDTYLGDDRDCKIQPVQEELALIRGVERLTELIPGALLACVNFDIYSVLTIIQPL